MTSSPFHLTQLAVPLAIAYAVSALTIPRVIRVAQRFRILDFPDGQRRSHSAPIPRLGGIGVLLGMFVAVLVGPAVVGFLERSHPGWFPISALAPALAAGGAILFVVGLFDDLFDVPPWSKLLAQVAAAWLLWEAGFRMQLLVLPGGAELDLGRLGMPVTLLWLVGVSNAFNLVDGLDGLAGSVASIALVAAAAVSLALGTPVVAWYTMALLGATLAFLRHNVPPARVFMGDSGTLVIGFLLAVFTVAGAARRDGGVHILVPILLLSYPLLDTGIAIIRRWLRGDPLSRADQRHIHHRLRGIGFSPGAALAVICTLSATLALLGVATPLVPPAMSVVIAGAGGLVLLVLLHYGTRWLRYHEFDQAARSAVAALREFSGGIRDLIHVREAAEAIEQAGSLADVERLLDGIRVRFGLEWVELRSAHRKSGLRPRDVIELHESALCHLEYPLPADPASGQGAVLVIAKRPRSTGCTVSLEQLARVLVPAIDQWRRTAGFEFRAPAEFGVASGLPAPVFHVQIPISAAQLPAAPARPRTRR